MAGPRGVLVRIKRAVPFAGSHHLLMGVLIAFIVLNSLVLAGCSAYSPMVSIYVLSLSHAKNQAEGPSYLNPNISSLFSELRGQSPLEVRVGFFGVCVNDKGTFWTCSTNPAQLVEQIGVDADPLNLVYLSEKFRDDVLFPGFHIMALVLSFITILVLSTFPGWEESRDTNTGTDVDIKPFPSRPVSQLCLLLMFCSSICMIVSSIWQHLGAVATANVAENMGYGSIEASVGALATTLTWVGFAAVTIVAIALLVMILSIMVLDRLTADSEVSLASTPSSSIGSTRRVSGSGPPGNPEIDEPPLTDPWDPFYDEFHGKGLPQPTSGSRQRRGTAGPTRTDTGLSKTGRGKREESARITKMSKVTSWRPGIPPPPPPPPVDKLLRRESMPSPKAGPLADGVARSGDDEKGKGKAAEVEKTLPPSEIPLPPSTNASSPDLYSSASEMAFLPWKSDPAPLPPSPDLKEKVKDV